MTARVILFDLDGVLTLPDEVFSLVYSRSKGLDYEPFERYFNNEWIEVVTGKKDLKQSIVENKELWQWSGTPEELLAYWFRTEDARNQELLNLIGKFRAKGIRCYLTTDQEKYRGEYIQDVMFKGLLDGYFISGELGYTKTNPKFFEIVVEHLQEKHPELSSQDIVFFDDSQSKLDTACSVGISGQLYKHIGQVEKLLSEIHPEN